MELAARIGTMSENGSNIKTIVYDGDAITNAAQFRDWAENKLGSRHWFLISKSLVAPNTYNQIHGGMLDYDTLCLRYRNGFVNQAMWGGNFDAFVNAGDEFYCIPNPQYTEGGGTKCLTPRCSYRRPALRSARFCAHSQEWEAAA